MGETLIFGPISVKFRSINSINSIPSESLVSYNILIWRGYRHRNITSAPSYRVDGWMGGLVGRDITGGTNGGGYGYNN